MDVGKLQAQLAEFTLSMFREGVLEREQFKLLQGYRDDDSGTDFVVDVLSLYFKDTESTIHNLGEFLCQAYEDIDFQVVTATAHKLKGASLSVGARRVANTCIQFRICSEEKNLEGCKRCLQQLKFEHSLMKSNFLHMLQLEQKIVLAGGKLPKDDF